VRFKYNHFCIYSTYYPITLTLTHVILCYRHIIIDVMFKYIVGTLFVRAHKGVMYSYRYLRVKYTTDVLYFTLALLVQMAKSICIFAQLN
jgi:hypothetical protein